MNLLQGQNNEGVEDEAYKQLTWQIWVSEPLNKDADLLIKWSRTSFFGGSPVSKPMVIDGKEFASFYKCSEEWAMKYTLATALANYKHVMLFKHGEQMPLELFLKDVKRPTDGILGDAASMGRSGGMC